ncbi:MAG: TetR/AcrR family transcriptional regulator [Mycetocola sp.]
MARRSQSTDPRAIRLRESVKAAALDLVREKNVDDFNLNDLLARAGVSRQGFYEHFADRDDAVLHALIDDFGEAFARVDAESDVRGLLRALTHSVDGQRAVYGHLRSAVVFDQIVDHWRTAMTPAVRRLVGATSANMALEPEEVDTMVAFTVGGLVELLRVWLRSTHPISAGREADLLWAQAQRSLLI